jgi:sugar phosphate permease
MVFKFLAGVIATTLVIAFLSPPVLKLQDYALAVVILIGVVLMLVDLWQSMQSKDD